MTNTTYPERLDIADPDTRRRVEAMEAAIMRRRQEGQNR